MTPPGDATDEATHDATDEATHDATDEATHDATDEFLTTDEECRYLSIRFSIA